MSEKVDAITEGRGARLQAIPKPRFMVEVDERSRLVEVKLSSNILRSTRLLGALPSPALSIIVVAMRLGSSKLLPPPLSCLLLFPSKIK